MTARVRATALRLLVASLTTATAFALACGSSPGGGGGGGGGSPAGADGGAAAIPDGGDLGPAPATLADYSAGDCPDLTTGSNTFESGGGPRSFLLYQPATTQGAGLLFLWHGLGDSAANFARAFQASSLATARNLVVVVPTPILNVVPASPPTWGFLGDATRDLTLFDDVRTCAARKLGIDTRKVYSMGFSAGALWTSYLLMHRSTSLAAVTAFSGGASADGQFSPRWERPENDTPALLTEGGSTDVFAGIVRFQNLVNYLYEQLVDAGVTTMKCDHNGGHTVPSGGGTWGVDWLVAHRYGQPSPFAGASERPAGFPTICNAPNAAP